MISSGDPFLPLAGSLDLAGTEVLLSIPPASILKIVLPFQALIFLRHTLALGEFHNRLALGVQELQWNRRESILGLVQCLPHLLVDANQLHVSFIDHPLVISRKGELIGYLFL